MPNLPAGIEILVWNLHLQKKPSDEVIVWMMRDQQPNMSKPIAFAPIQQYRNYENKLKQSMEGIALSIWHNARGSYA